MVDITHIFSVLVLCFTLCHAASSEYVTNACTTKSIQQASLYPGYCAFEWYSGANYPRGIRVAANNDVLYMDAGTNSIKVLWESAADAVSSATLVDGSNEGLNHALYIRGGWLYASSATNVYRWPYTAGTRSMLSAKQVVVKNVPCCHHSSRALEFDSQGRLYVQSGSGSNVDPNPSHAMIRRFKLPASIPAGGLDWNSATIFASGLRNEAGIRFDPSGTLWGVENGRDDLARDDLGGDIHENNPSEEMNKFSTSGKFYGYPYCWSQYNLTTTPSHPKGTQWADPNFIGDGKHTDAWCKNPSKVVKPAFNFGAHKAPLDLIFNHGTSSFAPNIADGNAFVAFHGSWDRVPAVGYSVSLVTMNKGNAVSEAPFFQYSGPGATGSNWPYRPVCLAWYKCGGVHPCLLVTSDTSGTIIALIPNN